MTGKTATLRERAAGRGRMRRHGAAATVASLVTALLAGGMLTGNSRSVSAQTSDPVSSSSMDALRSMFPGAEAQEEQPLMDRDGMRPPAPVIPPNLVIPAQPVVPPAPTVLDTGNAGSATPRAGTTVPSGLAPVSIGQPQQPKAPELLRPETSPTPPQPPVISSGMPSIKVEPRIKNRNLKGPSEASNPPRGSKKAAQQALDNAIDALPNIGSAIATPSDGGAWPTLGTLAPFIGALALPDADSAAGAGSATVGAPGLPGTLPGALPGALPGTLPGGLPASLTAPTDANAPSARETAATTPARLLPGVADTPKKATNTPKSREAQRKKDDATFKAWDKELDQAVKSVDFTSEEGLKYKGKQTRDKRFKGVITYPDGGRYEGQAVGGKRHGKGKMVYHHGGIYEGDWVDDEWHGEGVATVANGNRYEGGYIKGKKQGQGVYTWADGGRYEGGFLQGGFHGKGVRTFANGNKYVGNWKQGMRHGLGIMTYYDGDRYEGDWRTDKRHGDGTYVWRTGDRYEGEWVDGKRHGEGTFVFANGKRYEGPWRYDYRHGQGAMILRDGRKVTGMWFYGRSTADDEAKAKATANRR